MFREKATLQGWRASLEGSRQLLSISVFRLALSVCCGYPDIPRACPPSPTLGSTLIPVLLARLQTFHSSGTRRTRQYSVSYPNKWLMTSEFGPFSWLLYWTPNLSLERHFESVQHFNHALFTFLELLLWAILKLLLKWTDFCVRILVFHIFKAVWCNLEYTGLPEVVWKHSAVIRSSTRVVFPLLGRGTLNTGN